MKKTIAFLLSLILLLSVAGPGYSEYAFSQYTSGLPEDVAIHCSESVMDVMGIEDLAKLVEMVKYSAEPQAVDLLRAGFPAFEEAARNNQLGTQIGLNIEYDDNHAPMAKVICSFDVDDQGRLFCSYCLIVNAFTLAERDEAGNLVWDPVTGKLRLTTDPTNMDAFSCILTHEMMHAFMDDYNRSGMTGIIDPDMLSLPAYATEEDAAAVLAQQQVIEFTKWFSEGTATAVENAFMCLQDSYDELRTYGGEGIDGWYTPEDLQYAFAATALPTGMDPEEYEAMVVPCFDIRVSAYVSGYLACLYLAELAANSEGFSACSVTPDGFEVVDSAVLRFGLNDILRMLHEGVTLDDIIYNISNGRFYDTADFEDAFIAYDDDSAIFTSILLNYFLRLSREPGRRNPANGSLLSPFDVDYLTQIDCTKNAQSGLYQIINSSDVVDSTADLRDVTDAGKSLSSLGYWSNTTVGAGSYYDDYTGMYSDPGYPVFPYGA